MSQVPGWIRTSALAAVFVAVAFAPAVFARGAKGGHSGGGHARAAHAAPRPHPANHMPKAPHPAKSNQAKPHQAKPNQAKSNAVKPNQAKPNAVKPNQAKSNVVKPNQAMSHRTRTNQATTSGTTTNGTTTNTNVNSQNVNRRSGTYRRPPRRYAMPYRGAYRGNRYAGTNRYNRAIISKLRSAHSTLARIDHDYQGHRVRAMHSIRSAIRQWSHSSSRRSYGYRSSGIRTNRAGTGTGTGRRGRMSQAQSDSRMRRALGILQMVGSHMMNNSGSTSHVPGTGACPEGGQRVRASRCGSPVE